MNSAKCNGEDIYFMCEIQCILIDFSYFISYNHFLAIQMWKLNEKRNLRCFYEDDAEAAVFCVNLYFTNKNCAMIEILCSL